MTSYRGFETKAEAQAYQKKNGGYLCWDKRTKAGKPTGCGVDYWYCVHLGGLNAEKYPYAVTHNNV